MKTVYEIWCIRPGYPDYEYTMTHVLPVLPDHITRRDVVSIDREVLERTMRWLEATSPSDVEYEIREKEYADSHCI